MNKRWIEEDGKYILYFTPFYEDEKIAEIFHENDSGWCYSSKLLDKDEEFLGSDTLQEAKKDVEDLIESYFEEEINYYQDILNRFKK